MIRSLSFFKPTRIFECTGAVIYIWDVVEKSRHDQEDTDSEEEDTEIEEYDEEEDSNSQYEETEESREEWFLPSWWIDSSFHE